MITRRGREREVDHPQGNSEFVDAEANFALANAGALHERPTCSRRLLLCRTKDMEDGDIQQRRRGNETGDHSYGGL